MKQKAFLIVCSGRDKNKDVLIALLSTECNFAFEILEDKVYIYFVILDIYPPHSISFGGQVVRPRRKSPITERNIKLSKASSRA